jgi:hypothetical protein
MDVRLAEAKGDQKACYARLSTTEQRLIDAEIARVLPKTPEARRAFLEDYFVINTKGEEWQAQRLQTVWPFTETQEILWLEFCRDWIANKPLRLLMLKARQIRWSTLCQGVIFQLMISTKLTNTLVIADQQDRSTQIFGMASLAYRYLPWWMRPELELDNRGEGIFRFDRKDKLDKINNPGLNSTYFIDAANKLNGSSRGFTLHNVHATEFGLWLRARILTSDIIPAVPYKNPNVMFFVEGTAKGAGEMNAFLKMWKLASDGKGLFRPVFAAWWRERTYCKPFPSALEESQFDFTKEEKELSDKVVDEFGYQITKEQMSWRREQAEQVEATEGDAEMVEQEYPSYPRSAFRSGGRCRFNLKTLAKIEVRDVRLPIWAGDIEHRRDPTDPEKDRPVLIRYFQHSPYSTVPLSPTEKSMLNAAPIWVWEWPNSKDLYYGASDPGRGMVGKDCSAAQIFRVPRRHGQRIRQCFEYRGYADAKELSKIVNTVGRMYNTCEWAPECNTLTEHIGNLITIHKYPKIYRWRRRDKTHNATTWFFGWETNSKSREDLQTRFDSHLKDDSIEIKSVRLLTECQNFIELDEGGRFEAAPGEKDDTLFAGMICVFCLLELDPRLFELVETEQVPDPTRGLHNTDHSLFDDAERPGIPDYNML